MNLFKKLLISLITISIVGCATKGSNTSLVRDDKRGVIMEDVIVERTVTRSTVERPNCNCKHQESPKSDEEKRQEKNIIATVVYVTTLMLLNK
jgi:hypothetical protein